MKIVYFAAFLVLTTIGFTNVIIEEAIVSEISVDKWKGSWAAPGGKYVKFLKIKIIKYRLESETPEDQKMLDSIDPETGEMEVTLEKYPGTYIGGGAPLVKFFKKHISFFSKKVKPELKVVGTLRFGKIPSNTDRNDYNLLVDPVFTSRKGVLDIQKWSVSRNPSAPMSVEELKRERFEKLYGEYIPLK